MKVNTFEIIYGHTFYGPNRLAVIYWYDKVGNYHREDGPAIEWADGYKVYYTNGTYAFSMKNEKVFI